MRCSGSRPRHFGRAQRTRHISIIPACASPVFPPLPPTRSGIADYTVELLDGSAARHRDRCLCRIDGGTGGLAAVAGAVHRPQRARLRLGAPRARPTTWSSTRWATPGATTTCGRTSSSGPAWSSCTTRTCTTRAPGRCCGRRAERDYRAELAFNHPALPPEAAEIGLERLCRAALLLLADAADRRRRRRGPSPCTTRAWRPTSPRFPGTPVHAIPHGRRRPGRATARGGRARPRSGTGSAPDAVVLTRLRRHHAAKSASSRSSRRWRSPGAISPSPAPAGRPGAARTLTRWRPRARWASTDLVDSRRLRPRPTSCRPTWRPATSCCRCAGPAARETSASWLRAIAAGRPTIVTDLAQQADVPTLDPRSLDGGPRAAHARTLEPVAVSIDILDEEHSLTLAAEAPDGRSRRCATRLGAAARAHWRATTRSSTWRRPTTTLLGEASGLRRPRGDAAGAPATGRDGPRAALLAAFRRRGRPRRCALNRGCTARRLRFPAPSPRPSPGPGGADRRGGRVRRAHVAADARRAAVSAAGRSWRRRSAGDSHPIGRRRRAPARRPTTGTGAGVGPTPPTVGEVLPGSPAARAGVRAGDTILQITNTATGRSVTFLPRAERADARCAAWRDAYWARPSRSARRQPARPGGTREAGSHRARRRSGACGPPMSGDGPRRISARSSSARDCRGLRRGAAGAAAARPCGPVLDRRARVRRCGCHRSHVARRRACAADSGPADHDGVRLAGDAAGVSDWSRWPSCYFPRKAACSSHHPWLHAMPVCRGAADCRDVRPWRGAFLAGVDGLAERRRGTRQPSGRLLLRSFAGGLLLNIAAMVEGVWRYRSNPDAQERRRVAVVTLHAGARHASPSRSGTACRCCLPRSVARGSPGRPGWRFRSTCSSPLPASGITYAVAVHRVLAPRVAMRQSLQYALARKTLDSAAALPATLLVVSLVEQRDRSLSDIVVGPAAVLCGAAGAVLVGLKFRDRERAWLDRRFFRTITTRARVLLSLPGRIPYETDPNELTALVVQQIDAALHPTMVAVLVAGVEPGTLVPVAGAARHGRHAGRARRHRHDADVVGRHRWISISPTSGRRRGRLPPDEIEWLRVHRRHAVRAAVSKDRRRAPAGRARAGRQAIGGAVLDQTTARCSLPLRRRSAWGWTSRGCGAGDTMRTPSRQRG